MSGPISEIYEWSVYCDEPVDDDDEPCGFTGVVTVYRTGETFVWTCPEGHRHEYER